MPFCFSKKRGFQVSLITIYKLVLQELTGIKEKVTGVEERVTGIEERQKSMEIRQDEIYQVVRAIEHLNQVGRSEMDNQGIRLSC